MSAPRSYFLATDGKITIWRPQRRAKIYHSCTIRGFTRSWRSARPSGANSYPTVWIRAELFDELKAAQEKSGQRWDAWIANEHLPPVIREVLKLPPTKDATP